MTIFKALLKKEYLQAKRTFSSFILGIGMPIAFFLLFSSILLGELPKNIQPLVIRQTMMSMTAFSSISFALFTFPFSIQEDRKSYYIKHLSHSPVSIWQYFMAKVIRILVSFLLAIIFVFLSGRFVQDVSMPINDWLNSGLLLFFGAICFMPLGILLSFIKSSETLSVFGNILYMSLAILGGLWMPVDSFPSWLQSISKFTPTYHYNNMLISYFADKFSINSLIILVFYAIVILMISFIIKKKVEVN
ncbi:ABC transporter permease [Streptococcus pacificus]|uniref:ABC transporter permease n=1 Tax=Streptococcus pacificus TaxID=2740577 RepID=A0ABS0ZJM9_9STRE|nr:ABC transporter permease [Streptococcus pacificus]MBJ8325923.1 ABC transporter permease [Streptococcus pacificus]